MPVHFTYSVLQLYQGNFPFFFWLYFLAQCFTVHCYLRINFDSCLHSSFTIRSDAFTSQVLTGSFMGPSLTSAHTERKREGGRKEENIQRCVNSPSFKTQATGLEFLWCPLGLFKPITTHVERSSPQKTVPLQHLSKKNVFSLQDIFRMGEKTWPSDVFLWGVKEIYTHGIGMSVQMCVSLCLREGMCKISMLLLHVTPQFRGSMLHWQHSLAMLAWLWKNKVLIYSLSLSTPPFLFSHTPPSYTQRDMRLFC